MATEYYLLLKDTALSVVAGEPPRVGELRGLTRHISCAHVEIVRH